MKKYKKKIVSFKKIDGKWYCDIKKWPKTLFAQTLMVGNANKLIEEFSEGNNYIKFEVISSNEYIDDFINSDYIELVKSSSTLTGGAYYWIEPTIISEELWLCPVTLFVLKEYPNYIYFKRIKE